MINKKCETKRNSGMNHNLRKIFTTLGASNHTDQEREQHDYYATDPKALEMLLELETFGNDVWEPACGEGHLSKVLRDHGFNVKSSDLINRGYEGAEVLDFLHTPVQTEQRDIITNPPYKIAQEFVKHALDISADGTKIAMFLKLQFLEGKSRREFFDKNPPAKVYVSSSRIKCAKNGDFESIGSSAVAYGWFVWEKGYKGDPAIKWFN